MPDKDKAPCQNALISFFARRIQGFEQGQGRGSIIAQGKVDVPEIQPDVDENRN